MLTRFTLGALTSWSLRGTAAQPPQVQGALPGAPSFVAPATFPTSVFPTYYQPASPTAEAQPALYDPILNTTFPLHLTDPKTIPTSDNDAVYYPEATANLTNSSSEALVQTSLAEIKSIISDDGGLAGNCSKCIAALSVGKVLAQTAPTYVPTALISLCQATKLASNSSCESAYAAGSFGAIWTQVLALADVTGLDGQYMCASLSTTFCPNPTTSPLNTTNVFPKPKPENATVPRPSGERVKVLHLSDFHLDPRFMVGREANCSSGLYCRYSSTPTSHIVFPAPLFGAYRCDTPYSLGLAALQSMPTLTGTGTDQANVAWTIYTGDLVSHDTQNQLSRAYVEYAETSVYHMLKSYINGPVFPVLGNHDFNPEKTDGPDSLPGPLGKQFSWNYEHVSALWRHNGWVYESEATQAKLHYAASESLWSSYHYAEYGFLVSF